MTADEIKAKLFPLKWYEEAELISQFHTLRVLQYGEPSRLHKGWRIADTAEELNMSFGKIAESLKLNKELTSDLKQMDRRSALQTIAERNKK